MFPHMTGIANQKNNPCLARKHLPWYLYQLTNGTALPMLLGYPRSERRTLLILVQTLVGILLKGPILSTTGTRALEYSYKCQGKFFPARQG